MRKYNKRSSLNLHVLEYLAEQMKLHPYWSTPKLQNAAQTKFPYANIPSASYLSGYRKRLGLPLRRRTPEEVAAEKAAKAIKKALTCSAVCANLHEFSSEEITRVIEVSLDLLNQRLSAYHRETGGTAHNPNANQTHQSSVRSLFLNPDQPTATYA